MSAKVDVLRACIKPVGYGVGDHRLFVIDVRTSSLVGDGINKIERPVSRRLNTRLADYKEKYVCSLEGNIVRHRLREKVARVHKEDLPKEVKRRKLDGIDEDAKAYTRGAEKSAEELSQGKYPSRRKRLSG